MGKATERPKTAERWVTAAFGALFVGAAIAIAYLLAEDHSVGALAAAVALGILGIDALVSAARNRRSLLSRIGPLP